MAAEIHTSEVRRCEECDAPLLRKVGEKPVHFRKRKFCGYSCSCKAAPRKSLEKRFLAKVEVADGCHNWTGAKNGSGYGSIRVDGQSKLAHRVAYMMAHGSIDDDAFVCHHCDNPACVKVEHLFLGDHAANMADMSSKGRGRSTAGPDHHAAKLTPDKVRAIRADPRQHREIAADYGVSHMVVGAVKRREAWKHVD